MTNRFFLFFLLGACAVNARAEDGVRESVLPAVEVFGEGLETLSRPLAPQKVKAQKIKLYQFTDVNRALKHTSGVYTREEDGVGLRPNIGLRGTDPDRSKKVVLMEDGVLSSPAPYSAPAAYYTPSMNHVESLEIFKGFAAVPYGPNSVGGMINYLTAETPLTGTSEAVGSYASYASGNLKLMTGAPTTWGGYRFEVSRLQSDGFKSIDGGGKSGFLQNHVLTKLKWAPSGTDQSWVLTLGYSDEDSNETYLGLAGADFSASPYRRYAASALDEMKWTQKKIRLRHTAPVGSSAVVESTAYYQEFKRAWYRLDRFRDPNVSLRSILNDPTGTNQPYYDILSGKSDSSALGSSNGQLYMANNDRSYLSRGLQSKLSFEGFELSARYHQDRIRRDHTANSYEMVSGKMQRTSDPSRIDTVNEDSASALTLAGLYNWNLDAWTFTPVIRQERIDFRFEDNLNGTRKNREDSFTVYGLAVTRKLNDFMSARLSANTAATAAGLSSTGDEVREQARNYEFELKYLNPENSEELSYTAFVSRYEHLTGTCTASNGCANNLIDTQFDGGEALIAGHELQGAKSFQAGAVRVPIQAQLTLLRAEFTSDFQSTSPEWGVGSISSGDPLPYVPRLQALFSVGAEWRKLRQDLSIIYHSEVYDQSAPSGRTTINPYGILDWAAAYQATPELRLTAKIDNLLEREYAVSARPFGLRPGKPRLLQVGVGYTY